MQDKDQLEQFISDHKREFDNLAPPEGGWERVSQKLENSNNPQNTVMWYWKAAVTLLIATVAFLMLDKFKPVPIQPLEELSAVSDFKELETFYTSIISKKETKLAEAIKGEEALNYLATDIEELKFLYADLRELYVKGQATPEIYDRLMHLLRQRLHLINAQLDILAKEKLPEEMKLSIDLSM